MELNYVISITDRDQIQELAGLFQSLELNMGLIMLGKGTATSEQLSIYGLSNTEKAGRRARVGYSRVAMGSTCAFNPAWRTA